MLDPHATGGTTVTGVNDSRSSLTVGAVADLVGVSIRTLHHYDDISLVSPRDRSAAGYRIYCDDDVERLYSVLSYRELGFSLDQIQVLLDEPSVDALEHLRSQRTLLAEKIVHLQSMATAVDKMMEVKQMGKKLSAEEQREVFGDNWPGEEYAAEAEQRWGDTDAWRQSQQVESTLTKGDWHAIKADSDELEAALASAMAAGVTPGSIDGNALAERHRSSIQRFYDCDHRMHVNVSSMYVTDERFTKHYEDVAPGLARWLVEIVNANARTHGVELD